MSETKQKILFKSLKLFNALGISEVSLRNIADAAGMSVGNLQYHFKKREDIVEALYFQLVDEIDGIYFLKTDSLLRSFLEISKEMMTILYKYHFFLLDFISITRRNKKIKSHYSKLSKRRESESLQVLAVLIQQGLFREEKLKDEYHHLYKRIELMSNFWFSSILIQTKSLTKKSIEEYSLLVSKSVYPYLTKKGQTQYAKIYPFQVM